VNDVEKEAGMTPRQRIGTLLRRFPGYTRLRKVHAAGWENSFRRWRGERLILGTRPMTTRPADPVAPAPCEVHILTHEPDWRMGLWAAKTLYHHAGVDWPLIWHQGGPLSDRARAALQGHFPNSRFVSVAEADSVVEQGLTRLGLTTTLRARSTAVMLRKLIDLVFFGTAPRLVSLDTDILFFRFPTEIVTWADGGSEMNLFNRDLPSTFNLMSDRGATDRHGLTLFKGHNAGLALLRRTSLDLAEIDRYLQDPELRVDEGSSPLHLWLVEQSLHGLIGARHSAGLLPDTYRIALEPGLAVDGRPVIARHYANASRNLMFSEGIPALIRDGFLAALR
jgi:hypothetical protein